MATKKDQLVAFRSNSELVSDFAKAAEEREHKTVPEKLRDLMAEYINAS